MQLALAALLALVCAACGPAREETTVFAAASLRDVCGELGAAYEARAGEPVRFHFAGSNLLARQILAAPGADAFLSADEAQMDVVDRAGHVAPGSRVSLLSNRLVVVVPRDPDPGITAPADLTRVRRLSLANPEQVPAGRYARDWLERRALWAPLADRVLPALDVRAALAAVESGAAEAGICYATDLDRARGVRLAFAIPDEESPAISYAACAVDDSERGRAFVAFLVSPEARAAFERHGFRVLAR
ncbi:MAG TPA: molybdate ABC transporter substrate-binding protein [Myxococcota bacterium]|nr:molybdate ABC transporter substrate-binding protein [Myxococcota bacterium]